MKSINDNKLCGKQISSTLVLIVDQFQFASKSPAKLQDEMQDDTIIILTMASNHLFLA